MDDDPDLQLIDDDLFTAPSPLIPTVILPPHLAIPDEDDDSSNEVDPSRILLPPSPVPPEEVVDQDCQDQDPLPTTDESKGPFTTDEKQCRICFGGEEDEDECGRLISPCVCTGSMRVSFLWMTFQYS